MIYIQGTDGVNFNLVDSLTGKARSYTRKQIEEIVLQGKHIGGTTKTKEGKVIIYCQSNNFLYDFARKVSVTLSKLVLLKKVEDIEEQKHSVEKIAKDYGVIDKGDRLKIDIGAKTVLLPYQDMMMKYDDKGNFEFVTRTNMLSVTDNKVTEFSKLGVDAFNYIYLELKGTKYTMKQLTDLLTSVDSFFNPNCISYIGITPSNRMFKFMHKSAWNIIIYSVKFGTVEDLRKEWPKIRNRHAEQSTGFYRYASNVANNTNIDNNDLAVLKATKKEYSLDVAGLHQKYPTLHDVYFGNC